MLIYVWVKFLIWRLSTFAFKPFICMSKKLLHEDNNLVSVLDGKWTNWTECTKTCDKGLTTKKKFCTKGSASKHQVFLCGRLEVPCNDFKCDGRCSHCFIYSRLAYLESWNVTQRIVVGVTFLRPITHAALMNNCLQQIAYLKSRLRILHFLHFLHFRIPNIR